MKLTLLALAGLAQVAAAAPPAVEEAYEVWVERLTLPANEFGSVILRECDNCDPVTLRVEGDTRYVFDGQAMTLKAFRAAVLNMAGRDEAVGTVVYRLKDNRVRQINVSTPPETSGERSFETRG
ncbi:MAG TPA: hypothetical protein VJ883_05920 [Woeseiaceae bacterium]|nr:hypothetical protein [Woeseiaceae bacterium]